MCGKFRRHAEPRAPFQIAHALHRRIDGQHQGFAAGGFGAPDQGQGAGAAVLPVQLKPEWRRVVSSLRMQDGVNIFHRNAGLGAQHHAGGTGQSGVGRGDLAIRMREPLVGDRGKQHRPVQCATRQLDAGMSAGQ